QLKTYYKNTKSNIKKELSKEKAELFKTGGGCSLKRSDRDNPLYEIVQAEITPLSNPYDSSNSYYNDEPLPSTSRGNSQANYENSFQEFLELDRARKIGTFDDDTSDDDDDDDNDGPATSANLVDIEPVSSAGAIGVVPSSVHAPTTPTPTVGVTAGAAGVAAGAAGVASGAAGAAAGAVGAAAGAVGLSSVHAPTTPTPNVIRNTKRKRINFNTLREYVGEMGELKKRKYELQNKLLELTIKKLEKELNTPNE
ncbi:AAEL000998-PA, partial [Aedes aegypti]